MGCDTGVWLLFQIPVPQPREKLCKLGAEDMMIVVDGVIPPLSSRPVR